MILLCSSHCFQVTNLSACLTQQQQSADNKKKDVNNFIIWAQPPLIGQKHTNNMHGHFLFLMSPGCRHHLKAGYPGCS